MLGAGKTGLTLAVALLKTGSVVRLVDNYVTNLTSQLKKIGASEDPALAKRLSLINPEEIEWDKVGRLYCSPGIPTNHPQPHSVVKRAQEYNIPIRSDIDWLLDQISSKTPVVGVTGTNGKSTTVALTAYILSQYKELAPALAGANFGVPAAIMVEKNPTTYVLELSSFQLELMNTPRVNVGALLNITPDHMDRYASFEDYVAAKEKLIDLLSPNGLMVVGVDDEHSRSIFEKYKSIHKLVPISVKRELEVGVSWLEGKIYNNYFKGQPKHISLADAAYKNLPGEHNRQNILTAITIAMSLGIELSDYLLNIINGFTSLPHRLELVYSSEKLSIYNDSKATNMDAASKALASFNNILWLAGGRLKDHNFTAVLPCLDKVSKIYAFGEAAPTLVDYFSGKIEIASFSRLKEALLAAWSDAKKGGTISSKVILLAPGGSSFDEFTNFEHRGDSYRTWCKELSQLSEYK